MFELNKYGKIVINNKEVYYGCVSQVDEEHSILQLYVIDWRDREIRPHKFYAITAPMSAVVIKYNVEGMMDADN